MKTSANSGSLVASDGSLILAIDTCGPSGSVALGRLEGGSAEVLGQIELEGRSYSSTLVAAVGELLAQSGVALRDLGAIVAVNGPGSFTGVRVGLSAVKGLAEGARIPVAAVSRLEVLAAKTGVASAALDAHRHEVFLRIDEDDRVQTHKEDRVPTDKEDRVPQVPILGPGKPHPSIGLLSRELLAGAHELAAIAPPSRIALCDEAAALLLGSAWPAAELVRTEAPTAADALRLCAPRVLAGDFVDLALLDGHYLRRSDAEIFGEPAIAAPECP